METTCLKDDSGAVIFVPSRPLRARLIIGGMLSFFVVFFGYYLFSGLIEYVLHATRGEWLRALPGFLLVFAIFLAFAIPTWRIIFGRTRVILDLYQGKILDVLDLLVYRRVKTYPVDQAKEVTIVIKKVSSSGDSATTNAVEIHLDNGKLITVSLEDNMEDAKELARQVAGHLRVDVVETSDRDEPTESP